MSRLICYALAPTHLLWATSLLLDPLQYLGKPVIPPIFAAFHIAAAVLLLSRYRIYGGWVTVAILSYYWAFVKPREPIAEPQSVGILLISTILILPHLQGLFKNRIPSDISPFVVRIGLAYPFLEWGLDALRNPSHFIAYFEENPLTRQALSAWNSATAAFLLGIFEVTLAVVLILGVVNRRACFVALAALIAFSVVAAYPLALPQDISLAAAAIYLARNGRGAFSLDHAFKSVFSSSR